MQVLFFIMMYNIDKPVVFTLVVPHRSSCYSCIPISGICVIRNLFKAIHIFTTEITIPDFSNTQNMVKTKYIYS